MAAASPYRRFARQAFDKLAFTAPLGRAGGALPGLLLAPFTAIALAVGRPRDGAKRVRRALQLSIFEGMAAEVVGACAGGSLLTGWALHLGASPFLVGLLVSLTQFSQWVQFPAAWITSRFGARRTALWTVSLSRQILWPLVFLPFLPIGPALQQSLLLATALLSALLAVIGNNAWVAWMGELVPRQIRGRYFGRRTAICTAAAALGNFASGAVLDVAKAHGHEGLALSLLALTACLAGLVATVLMYKQQACTEAPAPDPIRLGIESISCALRHDGARRFLVYQFAWNIAVGLAGSFFAVFELNDLHMGFALVALQGTAGSLVRMLVAPAWGRAIDRVGARPVLVTCSLLIAQIPLWWLFASPGHLWPLVLDAVFTGVFWGGHGQALFQMPLAVSPQKGRPFYLAAFATAAGLAFALASGLGGLLAGRLPHGVEVLGHPFANYQVLFAISAVLRGGAALLSLRLTEPSSRSVRALFGLARAPQRVEGALDVGPASQAG